MAKASFPQGTITVAQAQEMFMAMADSQVGYRSGSYQWSLYGKGSRWDDDWNGRQVYWCYLGMSWVMAQTFGAKAAIAGIGLQNSHPNWPPAGGTATWLLWEWFRANNRWVGMERAQPGDISLQSWGRTGKPTDHVEIVSGYYRASDDSYPTIGFNTSAGNPTAGARVARVRRYRRPTVGIYRPNWEALVMVYNAQKIAEGITELSGTVIDHLELLGYKGSVDGVKDFQREHGLTVDGIVGPKTSARLETEVSKAIDELMAAIKQVDTKVDKLRGERLNFDTKTRDQLDTLLDTTEEHRRQLNTVGRVAAEARDQWAVEEQRTTLVKKILGYDLYGFSLHWWLRRGFLGRKFDHKNYPFDPGSPADLEHRTAEAVTGETIPPYGGAEKRPGEVTPGKGEDDINVPLPIHPTPEEQERQP